LYKQNSHVQIRLGMIRYIYLDEINVDEVGFRIERVMDFV